MIKNKLSTKNKFHKDPNKLYLKKIRIFPAFLYKYLDKWLKKMSKEGWVIVHSGIVFFWFERSEPREREYFTYGLGTQEGKYSLEMRHPFLEKLYSVDDKKSKINSNKTKKLQIIEIDSDKIHDNFAYNEMVRDRDSLYLRYFIRNAIVIFIGVLISLILFF